MPDPSQLLAGQARLAPSVSPRSLVPNPTLGQLRRSALPAPLRRAGHQPVDGFGYGTSTARRRLGWRAARTAGRARGDFAPGGGSHLRFETGPEAPLAAALRSDLAQRSRR